LHEALKAIAQENNIKAFASFSDLRSAIRKSEILSLARWNFEGQIKKTKYYRIFRLSKNGKNSQ